MASLDLSSDRTPAAREARPRLRSSGSEPSAAGGAVSDAFLDHYLRRIDPEVAASFTEEQREAIKLMLGARQLARHLVELRRSIPIAGKRFYVVLLFGRERRQFQRLYSQGTATLGATLLGHGLTAIGCLLPFALLAALWF